MERIWYLYKVTRRWKIKNNSGLDWSELNDIVEDGELDEVFMSQDVDWEGLILILYECRAIYDLDKLSIITYYVSPSYKNAKFLFINDGSRGGRVATDGIEYGDEIEIKELLTANIDINVITESHDYIEYIYENEQADEHLYNKIKAADIITNLMKRFLKRIRIKKKEILLEYCPKVLVDLIFKYL